MRVKPKKQVIGTAKCHCCERDIPVKRNELGTLDMSCQWCDQTNYAKEGTEAHRLLMKRVTLFEAGPVVEPAAGEPTPVPVTQETPARHGARSVFDLMAGRK
ncbi:hypothetical protein WT29_23375 [Burkholderia stagnalis]|uniref:Uncharacterized protein n=1 Tax=Burkholderia stagnalis TaxID=1503054 RepID=A0A6L3MWP7_9BURK|nr:hypothetical protein [Burkholderia stagnalis]KAB0637270.1 hypothetical protein F7R25_16025 [Burkholderia stagnalis]KVW61791.1 hypothetical protein WT28_15815 [Burkholderia stagnalis]KVW75031.1 hypothetical protein WT29_23375 [Burkholderia stagnalis]KVX78587.1 hypothetical protein WT34_10605 [Burkholderia stagnalis]KWN53953.1 hypothetical protein WT89_23670 [Burkholderia stagnalis]